MIIGMRTEVEEDGLLDFLPENQSISCSTYTGLSAKISSELCGLLLLRHAYNFTLNYGLHHNLSEVDFVIAPHGILSQQLAETPTLEFFVLASNISDFLSSMTNKF